jgi:hypothetical protein
MAGNKYLKNVDGTPTEEAAIQTSSGVSDADKIVALDSTGKLDSSLLNLSDLQAFAAAQG